MSGVGEGTIVGRMSAADDRPSVRRRRLALGLAAALAAALLATQLWRPALQMLGAMLVAEDAPAPVDLLVVSNSNAVADAFEAAALYRDGVAPRVLMPGAMAEPRLARLRALDIPQLGEAQLVQAVLDRDGVPASAIARLSDTVEGTETEAALIAAFAEQQGVHRLLVVTARSHSARTRWRLRDLLPADVTVAVRSPRDDRFNPDAWWQSRDSTREVVFEYMRWLNSLLGDLWRAPAGPAPHA